MNTFRRLSKSTILAAVLCLALIHIGCKESITGPVKKEYTGEELFRGILFSQGPVAEKLPFAKYSPSYYTSDAGILAEAEQHISSIIDSIRKNDPEFFGNFQKEIQSGDRFRIRQTLLTTADVLVSTVVRDVQGLRENLLDQPNASHVSDSVRAVAKMILGEGIDTTGSVDRISRGALTSDAVERTAEIIKKMGFYKSLVGGGSGQSTTSAFVFIIIIFVLAFAFTISVAVNININLTTDPLSRKYGVRLVPGFQADEIVNQIAVNLGGPSL